MRTMGTGSSPVKSYYKVARLVVEKRKEHGEAAPEPIFEE